MDLALRYDIQQHFSMLSILHLGVYFRLRCLLLEQFTQTMSFLQFQNPMMFCQKP